MDKKNIVIGIALILAAFGALFWQTYEEQKRQQERGPEPSPAERAPAEADDPEEAPMFRPMEDLPDEAPEEEPEQLFAPAPEETDPVEEAGVEPVEEADDEVETFTLGNAFIEVTFTPVGGAVQSVRFLQTKRGGPDHFEFNADSPEPAMVLATRRADRMVPIGGAFEVVDLSGNHVVFQREIQEGIVLQREFRLHREDEGDPYIVSHESRFINQTGQRMSGMRELYIGLGTALPMGSDRRGEFLSFGYYDGNSADFTAIRHFRGSGGFLGIGSRAPRAQIFDDATRVVWATVKNQFFVSLINPREPGRGIFAQPIDLPHGMIEEGRSHQAVRGYVAFDLPSVETGGASSLAMDWYVGPKEFQRLNRMPDEQDKVMQFRFFGFFSKILMIFLYAVHFFVPSWGWSIVVMTILIKLIFWPLTGMAARSQRGMQKIQGPMKEIREKYKDNPQKMQKETMRIFKEHRVNPAAGCLPLIIQIPIFIGLFWMLRTAAELRYEPFLWVSDLSQPDTLTEVFGFPINILPLIMAFTMFLQMRMMPTMATADQTMQKVFKFMPFVILVILYNFSSGLVLYWTVQNILTILQQRITNKKLDRLEALEKEKGPAAAGKPAKPSAAKTESARSASGQGKPASGTGKTKTSGGPGGQRRSGPKKKK